MPRLIAAGGVLVLLAGATLGAQTPALKILVIAGEDAVNVVQQKTAVAPIVEIHDRNDQPVAGVAVKFAVTKGHAAFNGLSSVTVSTDAAGRATVAGFTPTGTGPVQLSASATVNGQTSTTTISQVNVATLAQAATVATAGAAAAGGSSGGVSATTLGIIGGVAGGGAAAALKLAAGDKGADTSASSGGNDSSGSTGGGGNGGGSGGGTPTGPSNTAPTTYSGPFSGTFVETVNSTGGNVTTSCVATRTVAGTLTMSLTQSNGNVSGNAFTTGTQTPVSQSGTCGPAGTVPFNTAGVVSGTPASMTWSNQQSATGGGVTVVTSTSFTGSLDSGVITGVISHSSSQSGSPNNNVVSGGGNATYPVTLR